MKRRPCKLGMVVVTLLLAGAIMNIAVAWGIAIAIPIQTYSGSCLSPDRRRLLIVSECFGTQHISSLPAAAADALDLVTEGKAIEVPRQLRTDEEHHHAHFEKRGWPSLALAWWYRKSPTNVVMSGIELPASDQHLVVRRLDSGWSITFRYGVSSRVLPTIPLWPGFAINTIFYAAILWGLFFVPRMVKRTLRRRRGLCPACAYPIGASPICTECGKPVTAKSVEP